MRDFLLLLVVGAAFVFGYFVMKNLDSFLERNQINAGLRYTADKNSLRIGVSNPLAADCLSGVLEKYSRLKPEVLVSLFSGTEDELIVELSDSKLDVIFLPASGAVPAKAWEHMGEVRLSHSPLSVSCGLSVEPITEECTLYRVLWTETKDAPAVSFFIECLFDYVGMDLKS